MASFTLPPDLAQWAEHSLAAGQHILATHNQGTVLLYQQGDCELVLKAPMGTGAALRARRATLQREYRAYERLAGLAGIPACYGMVAGRYLALEYVRGTPYRDAQIEDREHWFNELLATLQAVHARGVAHGDLKNKSNLLSTDEGRPCLIDFGTTVLRKDGFAPVNHRLFSLFCQLDLNAYVKHRVQGRFSDMTAADRALYRDSWPERLSRWYRRRRGQQGPRQGA